MKNYSDDQISLLELLAFKEDVFLMVAPSFVVDFDYKTFVPLMKGLGFDKVFEITFGAKMVNNNYQKFIVSNKDQEKFISSTCPLSVNLIIAKYPNLKKFLLPFNSPMIAMAKIIKKNFSKNKIVFLSPCNAKKIEAKKSGLIDCVITFKELKDIIEKEKPIPMKCSHLFDRFYNDYTKIYPLPGGLTKTLHLKGIFKENETISVDGQRNIINLFDSKPKQKFFDILFCKGGCIGGDGISIKTPIFFKKFSVTSYLKQSSKEKIGNRKGLEKYTKGISFKKKF
ncbi:MAG: [Fe-Fe] hydrogenase large subunit C-terminal domain-containing protein [Candidatus ainarchaeum sp.]|nr:[Fe-Fe] hydrogenase large subunit C-terminal domain-containing protein [Candidatus ainarchaeum sp.]